MSLHAVTRSEVTRDDGHTLRVFDTGPGEADALTLFWFHGSPQTGAPLDPLLEAAARRGIRLVSYARPSYGSTPRPGRDVASAAADVAQIASTLQIDQFAVMGASGGGPHALACAALLPDMVTGAVALAGIAPHTADFDWFDGMSDSSALRAALVGREERARFAEVEEFDEESFIAADYAALNGRWASLGADVGRADEFGPDGLIDDDMAFATPWGFDLARVIQPVLFVQGALDRVVPLAHAQWQARHCPHSELWVRPRDGHISVLDAAPVAMDWLLANARMDD